MTFHLTTEFAESLFSKPNPNITDENGNTLLSYFCEENNVDAVAILLKNGADPNICGSYSVYSSKIFSPLYKALISTRTTYRHDKNKVPTQEPKIKICKMLLEAGAKVDTEKSPLQAYLSSFRNCYYNDLPIDTNVIRMLLKSGADPNKAADYIIPFSSEFELEAFELFIEHGLDVNHIYQSTTLLHKCFQHFDTSTREHRKMKGDVFKLIRILLREGAKLNVKNFQGNTPLSHLMFCEENEQTLSYLILNYGLHATDENRRAIFHHFKDTKYANDNLIKVLTGGDLELTQEEEKYIADYDKKIKRHNYKELYGDLFNNAIKELNMDKIVTPEIVDALFNNLA